MQAQQKLGLMVRRGSRGSLKKIESPSASTSSPLRRGALGSDLEMIGLWRQESEVSRAQSSLNSLRSSYTQLKKESQRRLSGASLCNTSFENDRVEMPSAFLNFLFVVVTVLSVDKLLDATVSLLQKYIHRLPFLMRFSFIRVLLRRGDSFADSLSGMTHCSSEDDPDLGDSRFSDIQDAMDEVSAYEEVTTSATIVTAIDEDVDDYGFFADFEEVPPAHTDIYVDPFHSLGNSRSSVMSSLCTLEETEEEEE